MGTIVELKSDRGAQTKRWAHMIDLMGKNLLAWPAHAKTRSTKTWRKFRTQMEDAELNYQYQSFGVPGLGLKRGLEQDLVVAPYATALALMVRPREAVANLARLAAEGAEGPYGMYESIDYTPERLPAKARGV